MDYQNVWGIIANNPVLPWQLIYFMATEDKIKNTSALVLMQCWMLPEVLSNILQEKDQELIIPLKGQSTDFCNAKY